MGAVDKIDVAILCGGLGTRISEQLHGKPKPMIDIEGKPFLDILVSRLKNFGFNRFIFCSGYKGEQIEEYFAGRGECYFSHERSPLGTAGALKLATNYFVNKDILLLNGDSFCTIDYHDFVDFHLSNNGILSVVVAPIQGRCDGGSVCVDKENRIVSFIEKGIGSNFINAGVYLLKSNLLDYIPIEKKCSLEFDIFPTLKSGLAFAYSTQKRLFDVGTPERLREFREIYRDLKFTGERP